MSKSLLKKSSEELSDAAVKELSCHNHFEKYKKCIEDNSKSRNFKDCPKLMNDFRFCLIYTENQRKDLLTKN